MSVTVTVLMATHTSEVFVWSVAYVIFDAAPAGSDLVYFAFVNYTTLGYEDVLPMERWRLIAPITAMNGLLLSGWSTAVIFEVLRRTITQNSPKSPMDKRCSTISHANITAKAFQSKQGLRNRSAIVQAVSPDSA